MDKLKTEKLIIIGSGPAGLTAAIYTARGGLNPLVVAGREAGGQLMLAPEVEDFPGFPESVAGPELMDRMRKQAERFKVRFVNEDVISADLSKKPFVIKTETLILNSDSLILATGASAQWLGLESEQRLRGRGVSACAVCDGFFFKNKKVAIIGGGDTALKEANYLAKICKQVTIVHRREKLRAQPILQESVKSKPNIDIIFNSELEEVLGQERVAGLKLKNTQTGETRELTVDGVFIAVGHKPNTEFLKGELELDEKGYIIVKNETRTSVEGIFVAGDVSDRRYRQAVTAAGAGCKAAFDVEEYLEKV